MLIYNVTIQMNWEIHETWLQWMQEIHMPAVVGTGCFTDSRLLRVLETDETDGPTYAAQYTASTRDQYDRYIAEYSQALRQDGIEKWGSGFIAFRTLMTIVV